MFSIFGQLTKPRTANSEVNSSPTAVALRLGVLSPRGSWLGDPVAVVLLLTAERWRWRLRWRCHRLRLGGKRHNGCGGVGSGGAVLRVGEAVQVLAGGVDGAVNRTLGGATDAVLLCLVQVVGDAGFCKQKKKLLFIHSIIHLL